MIGFLYLGNTVTIFAQNGSFLVDSAQSELNFKVSHMGPFKVKGSFREFSGIFQYAEGVFQSLEAEVMFASVDTGNDERDEILKTEPYFDEARFPVLSFKAERLESNREERIIVGELTIKDQKRELRFPVTIAYDSTADKITLEGKARIRRKEYDLVFGSMNGLIGDKVDIQLRIVAIGQ
ncbi:MAG: YceI family protein [Bacteroidia bacterium]|nr:YceI family protein [Bacteroidia bacterium]MBT8269169.1 YceI family protein [Bacteroidia bacterium]NNF82254.1 YceI family protein [Flavobacteriaceae bacterium]NNK70301.1 YceI family protein [Flavobacteriaceae bacterium]NNL79212.1 YceI family protein [Flavobacteriaceae bacterium]